MPPFNCETYRINVAGLEYHNVTSKSEYKQIGKALKEEKQATTVRVMHDQARADFTRKAALYIAIDFEQWEQDHSSVTEFGISTFDTSLPEQCRSVKTRHLLIEE